MTERTGRHAAALDAVETLIIRQLSAGAADDEIELAQGEPGAGRPECVAWRPACRRFRCQDDTRRRAGLPHAEPVLHSEPVPHSEPDGTPPDAPPTTTGLPRRLLTCRAEYGSGRTDTALRTDTGGWQGSRNGDRARRPDRTGPDRTGPAIARRRARDRTGADRTGPDRTGPRPQAPRPGRAPRRTGASCRPGYDPRSRSCRPPCAAAAGAAKVSCGSSGCTRTC